MKTASNSQTTTKDDLKKLRSELGEDFKNYAGMLHERFTDQVKVVAEQYTTINKRLTGVESKTTILVETVGEMKVEMTKMKDDISVLRIDMKEVKEELLPKAIRKASSLENRVAVLESRA